MLKRNNKVYKVVLNLFKRSLRPVGDPIGTPHSYGKWGSTRSHGKIHCRCVVLQNV